MNAPAPQPAAIWALVPIVVAMVASAALTTVVPAFPGMTAWHGATVGAFAAAFLLARAHLAWVLIAAIVGLQTLAFNAWLAGDPEKQHDAWPKTLMGFGAALFLGVVLGLIVQRIRSRRRGRRPDAF